MNILLENFNPDWEQLRQQKLTLLELVDSVSPAERLYDDLFGVIQLLDYIQDQAAISTLWTEEEIFGELENDL